MLLLIMMHALSAYQPISTGSNSLKKIKPEILLSFRALKNNMNLIICRTISEQIEVQSGRNEPAHHRIMHKRTVLGVEKIAYPQRSLYTVTISGNHR